MSILDRLNLLIRSNVNDSLGRTGHPSSRKVLGEIEAGIRDARRQQIELRRGEKMLIEQIREAREKADTWEERAMLALRQGDEELAREALVMKNRATIETRRLRDQLDDHRSHIKDLERALEALEMKLEGRRTRISAISTSASPQKQLSDWDRRLQERQKREESSRPSGGPSSSFQEQDESRFDTSKTFREMDRMASKIDSMEAELEAMRELGEGDPRRTELERKFREMENRGRSTAPGRESRSSRPPIDDDLSDLKKMFE